MNKTLEDRVRSAVRHIADEPDFAAKAFAPQTKPHPDQHPPAWRLLARRPLAGRPQTGRPLARRGLVLRPARRLLAWRGFVLPSQGWRRLAPVAVAIAVLALVATVALAPGIGLRRGTPPVASSGNDVVLPREIAAMSALTANLSDAPLGRPGLVVMRQAVPATLFGLTQVVVVGSDGRTYRRVDLAEQRGGIGADGEQRGAQALLSPDGRHLAIGRYRAAATEIPLLDLITGQRRDIRLDKPMRYHLMAWSPDGRKLAMALDADTATTDDHFQSGQKFHRGYPLAILDLDTGAFTTMFGILFNPLGNVAQFSPDGQELALNTMTDIDTSVPVSWLTFVVLGGPDARIGHSIRSDSGWFGGWTGAGHAVVFGSDGDQVRVRVVESEHGKEMRPPIQIARSRATLLGWRSPTVMLALVNGAGSEAMEIVAVDLETGREDVVSTFESGLLTETVSAHAAASLIGVAVSLPTSPQRGPWPTWAKLTLALTALLLAGLVTMRLHRRAPA